MNFLKKIFSFVLLVFFVAKAVCQELPQKPNPPKLVNDYTNTLTADQAYDIERKLVAFDDSTSTQIAVVIINNLNGSDISDYAVKLGRAWGIGGKKFNNGVLLLIAKGDRKMFIATGYGVEGALPDVTAKHIIEDVIKPNFKGDDYYRGIEEGTDAIIKSVKGEYQIPHARKSKGSGKGTLIFIIIIVVFILLSSSGGNRGGGFMSRRGYRGFGGPIFWGGGSSGGSSWGGGSSGGGGFGGFGGGSFGGGGSSGSW